MLGHHAGERPLEESPADLYDRYGLLILAYLRRHTASVDAIIIESHSLLEK